jgi:hypothetical protein
MCRTICVDIVGCCWFKYPLFVDRMVASTIVSGDHEDRNWMVQSIQNSACILTLREMRAGTVAQLLTRADMCLQTRCKSTIYSHSIVPGGLLV